MADATAVAHRSLAHRCGIRPRRSLELAQYPIANGFGTKLAADILGAKFGWVPDEPRWHELVEWADIIDGAQFPDARTAVELAHPALQLMTWVENNQDERLDAIAAHAVAMVDLAPAAPTDR